jgi:uncharacterized protein
VTLNRRVLSVGAALMAITLFAAVASLVIASVGGQSVSAETDQIPRRVTVSGHGQVAVTPDTGMVNLGVEVQNADLGAAQTEAADRMEAVIAAMRSAGIAEADITTANYNIWVDRDWDRPEQTIRGYNVSHSISVKVRNVDTVGEIVEAGLEAGANSVQGIYFTVEDPGDAVSQARERAINDARAKAEDLARLTGVTLGQVVTINEYSYAPYPVAAEERAYADDGFSGAAAPPINPGESLISVQVQVAWELN